MRFAALPVLVACAVITASSASFAATGYNPQTEQVANLNHMAPLQNPKFDRSSEILSRRILDRKNKVVGSIEDVVLTRSGNIAFLDVKFDRMQLSKPVFVNYTGFNIETVSNGYALAFDASEIENVYPQLLADIETAAGDDEDISLRKLQGITVQTESGKTVGKIDDVLFGNDGARAEAIYVGMTQGTLRGKSVAVPFNQVDLTSVNIAHVAVISDSTANTMADIAKGK